MSLVLSLTSAAIIAGVSIAPLAVAGIVMNVGGKQEQKSFETVFCDGELLVKTLADYGCCVEKIAENDFQVQTQCGVLRYFRNDESQPFQLLLEQVQDADALLEQIRLFETEYGRNVQTYTYNHIKENLTGDMQILSEMVLEDDSLLLTISI